MQSVDPVRREEVDPARTATLGTRPAQQIPALGGVPDGGHRGSPARLARTDIRDRQVEGHPASRSAATAAWHGQVHSGERHRACTSARSVTNALRQTMLHGPSAPTDSASRATTAPSGTSAAVNRITPPQQRHSVLRAVGTRAVLGRHLVRFSVRVAPHPRRASRQARPRRTAVGQEAPARQVAQDWVWPSHVLYVASPLSLRLLLVRRALACGRAMRGCSTGAEVLIRSPHNCLSGADR